MPISKDELIFYLDSMYSIAIDTIEKHYKLPRDELNCFMWNMVIDNNLGDLINNIEYALKDGEQGRLFASSLFRMMQNRKIANSLNNLSMKSKIFKGDITCCDFSKFYVQNLEKLIYPECYVACFMEEVNNSSVWGHYGDGHKGICLVFETDDDGLLELCGRIYGEGKEYHKYAFQKVTYKNSHNKINFFRTIRITSNTRLISSWHTNQNNKNSMLNKLSKKRRSTKTILE